MSTKINESLMDALLIEFVEKQEVFNACHMRLAKDNFSSEAGHEISIVVDAAKKKPVLDIGSSKYRSFCVCRWSDRKRRTWKK